MAVFDSLNTIGIFLQIFPYLVLSSGVSVVCCSDRNWLASVLYTHTDTHSEGLCSDTVTMHCKHHTSHQFVLRAVVPNSSSSLCDRGRSEGERNPKTGTWQPSPNTKTHLFHWHSGETLQIPLIWSSVIVC